MGRIRTIKPEFFTHEELYDAEEETGLPIRLAFAGLWTCCDREGRFEWKTRALKTQIIPYDPIDFARVLDALETRGFVVRYQVDGRVYGLVPGFSRHQVINNRESPSQIPPPPENLDTSVPSTREARVEHASTTRHDLAQGEGKGREGKGKEGEGKGREASATAAASSAQQPRSENGQDDPEAWPDDRLWQEVLHAVGLHGPTLPTHWMPPAAIRHVARWRHELGIPPARIVAEARSNRANHDDPPQGPKALDGAMKRLAADLQAPPLQPESGGSRGQGQPETLEQRQARWAKMTAGYAASSPSEETRS